MSHPDCGTYKWKEGRLTKCGIAESLFTFWISAVPSDWDNFKDEVANLNDEQQQDWFFELYKKFKKAENE